MRRVLMEAAVAATVVACSGGGGSSDGDLLTTSGIEDKVRRQIEAHTNAKVADLECPAAVPVETGRSFECTGELGSGAPFSIRVTQTDDQGNVEWEMLDPE